MTAIFISHSSRDGKLASEVIEWLISEGYENTFLDFDKHTGLKAGEHWERRLYAEIERCHAVILILTEDWLSSKWCFAEFTQARALGKTIFPLIKSTRSRALVAPEIQGIDLGSWDRKGKAALSEAIRKISDEAARGFVWDRSRAPYPGIHSFDSKDAAVFFGRDTEVREIIERLESHRVQGSRRVLLIVGASGSGKSSVLRAGVIPQIAREKRRWILVPTFRPGADPLTQLAKCLSETAGHADAWRSLLLSLAHPLDAMKLFLDELCLGTLRDCTLLISIDQFEEILTVTPVKERHAFASFINGICNSHIDLQIFFVGTIRSDALNDVLREHCLTCQLDTYLLRPIRFDRMLKVIDGPANVAAISLERGLATRILRDVTPETLPLLAFVLREMYERSTDRRFIGISAYEQLGDQKAGLNPLENSIKKSADEILRTYGNADEHRALRSAFLYHLIRLREDNTFVRQPANMSDIPRAAHSLIYRLTAARLLTINSSSSDADSTSTVEITHEALVRAWPLLANWLREEVEFLTVKAEIGRALDEWGQTPAESQREALLQGRILSRAVDALRLHPDGFTLNEQEFIDASRFRALRRHISVAMLGISVIILLAMTAIPKIIAEYGRRTALQCDLYAAEEDNNVNVAGVQFDKIVTVSAIPACESAMKADPENPRLIHNYARALDAAGNYKEAADKYRIAAELGWAWSKNNLGVLYLYGRGVPQNLSKGVKLLREASDAGNGQATVNFMYVDYTPLIDDDDEAVEMVCSGLRRSLLLAKIDDCKTVADLRPIIGNFKAQNSMDDSGLSLRVLERIGVVDNISTMFSRRRSGQ